MQQQMGEQLASKRDMSTRSSGDEPIPAPSNGMEGYGHFSATSTGVRLVIATESPRMDGAPMSPPRTPRIYGRDSRHMTLGEVQRQFSLRLTAAAANLGVSPMTLKTACRRFGACDDLLQPPGRFVKCSFCVLVSVCACVCV